jgi:hypothetical protein
VLREIGYGTVAHVMGQFMLFGCNKERMMEWLGSNIPTLQQGHKQVAVRALHHWTESNI